MPQALPNSVRYIKNGRGGQWWKVAKANGQLHAGWSEVAPSVLQGGDMVRAEALVREWWAGRRGATQDFNALRTLIDQPSQHVWITFADGSMWWCTVGDAVVTNPEGESADRGHFWLTCSRPWTNHSVGGRDLSVANLPGVVTAAQGFRGTVCEPDGWAEILRVIRDEEDPEAVAAAKAREAYEGAVLKLVHRLRAKDFEVLTDLILSRSGWARLAVIGGATEGLDIEVENASTDEIAFVQVKSRASQAVLDDYVSRFNARRERYHRMIFAVHKPTGRLVPPTGQPVQVWSGGKIAQLVVKHGLGEWVANHV